MATHEEQTKKLEGMTELHRSHAFEGVPDAILLGCLNTWPPGTLGHQHEELLITILNALCRHYGYGAVPQMAAMIEDVWRNPEKAAAYQKQMAERHETMRQGQEMLRKERANDV